MSHEYRKESDEVLYSEAGILDLTGADIDQLKTAAARNPRKRIRICAHHQPEDRLHEMLIVHERSAYVRPHKHSGKTESTHVIEGTVDVILFDDEGAITRVMELGDYKSGRIFYYRMAEPVYHMLIVRSDVLVFHETTDGPFNRKDTLFPDWAPEENDAAAVASFLGGLEESIRKNQSLRK